MQFDRAYFAGKVAAVTGGASGIGLALCEELLKSGADKVVLADFNRDNLALNEARLNEQYPGRVKGVFCDVTREADVKRMVEQARAFGGSRLDLLVNCAGAALAAKFTEAPDGLDLNNDFLKKAATNEDWERGFALNFFGALYGCRHALPIMLEQGGGQVVNIISGIAFSPMAYQSMYAATKAALNALTLSLRAEYASYGVKFNSATPGTTATAIFSGEGGTPPEAQTPHQSAQRILDGVANDNRLILGDDSDVDGAEKCFLPNPNGKITDLVFLKIARDRRKSGVFSLTHDVSSDVQRVMSPSDITELQAMADAFGDMSDMDATVKRMRAYLAQRASEQVPEAYFTGKTAVVTGGASGVGLALCEELLRCGVMRVVLADCNRAGLDTQTARLSDLYPGKVMNVLCDIAREEDVRAMIAKSAGFFENRFDLLINCAGIGQSGMFSEVSDEDEITARAHMSVVTPERWNELYAVNFYGALYACRAVLPVMLRQQGGGQIVNIVSGTAFSGMPYQSACASTKAALNALTLVLRYEYWDDGIKFNSATPGTTATAIFGGGPVPLSAQTPKQSARRILTGVAGNERLIYGGDDDAVNGMLWGNAKAARFWDGYFENAASLRRR